MTTANALIQNRSIPDRLSEFRQNMLLAGESGRDIFYSLPPEEPVGGLARAVGVRCTQVASLVQEAQNYVHLQIEHGIDEDQCSQMWTAFHHGTELLVYIEPSAEGVRNTLTGELEDERPHLSKEARRLGIEVSDCTKLALDLEGDMRKLRDAIERGEPSPTPEPPSEDYTVLSVAEVSGVLGLAETTIRDVAAGTTEPPTHLDHDILWWLQDRDASTFKFDVPNDVLREEGAEALIDE